YGYNYNTFVFNKPSEQAVLVGMKWWSSRTDDWGGGSWRMTSQALGHSKAELQVASANGRQCDWHVTWYYIKAVQKRPTPPPAPVAVEEPKPASLTPAATPKRIDQKAVDGAAPGEGVVRAMEGAVMVGEKVSDGMIEAGAALLAGGNSAAGVVAKDVAPAVADGVAGKVESALAMVGGVEVFGVCFAILAKAAQMMRTMKETQEQAALLLRRMLSLEAPLQQLHDAMAKTNTTLADKLKPSVESVRHISEVLEECHQCVETYFLNTSKFKKFISSSKWEQEFQERAQAVQVCVSDLGLSLQVINTSLSLSLSPSP
ncbi:hypothetical protein KIPB_009823, partial [Kipferlia bialata]